MGLMDKFKDAAGKAAEKAGTLKDSAMQSLEKAKEANEQRKAEKEAYIAQMEGEARAWTDNIVAQITESFDEAKQLLYNDVDDGTLDKFTKDYYEMLVLPGSRPNISCLTMNPYIDDKAVKKLTKRFSSYDGSEIPFIYIKESGGQEIVLTKTVILFRMRYADTKDFWCEGQIPVSKVNSFNIEIGEAVGAVYINGVKLSDIKVTGSYRQDFMSLNYYFECVAKKDFTIDVNEVDSQIRRKLGDKIYAQVSKYFIDEDEKLLFYAGGIDSMSAVDYIACTERQLIIVNREMMGATANVKQFYYEDVTAMATIQNSQSNDLLVAVIDTALTSALKICTLQVAVAGAKEHINNVYLVEATRIIAIYHEARKNIRQAKSQPTQTIVQQAAAPDALEQLQKLAGLKDAGIITEEEFNQKKAELLSKL